MYRRSEAEGRAPTTADVPASAERFADFALRLDHDAIPERVRRVALRHILDSIGLALAARRGPAAQILMDGLAPWSAGRGRILGYHTRLDVRDAALVNGLLIHGLDFDDTHMSSVMHASSSCLPVALAASAACKISGRQVIEAFVTAVEIAARLGQVTKGALQGQGFHPTGLLAGFGASVAFGRLIGLQREALVMAQGAALAGAPAVTRQFNLEGSWTKWLSPGLGAASGITAALVASRGFKAPRLVYEGRYGIFATHLESEASGLAAGQALIELTETLGFVWETADLAIKPVPACLFLHAPIEAANRLHIELGADLEKVVRIEVALPAQAFPVVCDPAERKRHPASRFEGQFSIYHAVSAALARGRFTLDELSEHALADKVVANLRDKVHCVIDDAADYPRRFTASVTCVLRSGATVKRDIRDNLGSPTRQLDDDDVIRKFRENTLGLPSSSVQECVDLVMNIAALDDISILLDHVERLGETSAN